MCPLPRCIPMPSPPAKPAWPWRGWLAALVVWGILVWSYYGTAFDFRALAEGVPDMGVYLQRLLPSAERPWQMRYLPEIQFRLAETIKIAFAATVVGTLFALPFALFATRNLASSPLVYNIARGFLNLLRTIPDLVLASILVAALGLGPLPGLMALILFTFGIVAKLLADTVETIDPGPLEAITAAGGTRLQRGLFAVFPQIAPEYLTYTFYALEINVRVAAVLGLVGAGGIGQTLKTDIDLFRHARVGMIIAAMFVVVLLIDGLSTWVRSKLV